MKHLFLSLFIHFQKSKQDYIVESSPWSQLAGRREVIRNARKAIKLYKKCKQPNETKVSKLLIVNSFWCRHILAGITYKSPSLVFLDRIVKKLKIKTRNVFKKVGVSCRVSWGVRSAESCHVVFIVFKLNGSWIQGVPKKFIPTIRWTLLICFSLQKIDMP